MRVDAEMNIERLRSETPGCRHVIHLDNAGASLMPQPVIDALTDHLALEIRLGGYRAADERSGDITASYHAIAELLNATPRNIAFIENATAAFSAAVSAIRFETGDVLLTTLDDYVSNQILYLSLAKRFGIEIVRAPVLTSGGVDPDAVRRLIAKRRPKLVAVTHVPTNSGLVQPVAEIGWHCREYEVPYLVDACQSVGQMPLDVEELHCDFLSASARKFLRGPRGCGFLYVSDRVLERGLEPLFIDMRGAQWEEADKFRPADDARRFENWEFAYVLLLATGAAARYALGIGIEPIERRVRDLAAHLRSALAEIDGVKVLDRGLEQAAIVTVAVSGWRPDLLQSRLRARGINANLSFREYAVIDFDSKGVDWALRVSPHYYNTHEELETFVGVLRQLITDLVR